MFKNYFWTAWRTLLRNKTFSIINISGLALGMACSLLIFLWVQDERQMDHSVPGAAQTYVVYEDLVSDGKPDPGYWTPGLLATELRRAIPEIQYASGFWDRTSETSVFEAGEKNIPFANTCYADSDFFKIFDYHLLAGTASTALAGIDDMAISRDMAEKFFGSSEAAYGKTLRYNNSRDFRVSAVFENQPTNISHHFEYLLNWKFLLHSVEWLGDWIYRSPNTFVRLQPHADPVKVEAKIKDILTAHLTNSRVGAGYFFADEEYQRLYENERTISQLSDSFSFLAIFISCLGLLGLAMFTAEQRRKEIGVRKVIGASIADIVGMLSKEIVKLILLSAVIATPLAWLAMSNWLQGYAYRTDISWWIFFVAGMIALLIALLTISYQALRAALANPVKTLRTE